jgi:hypothetical protein
MSALVAVVVEVRVRKCSNGQLCEQSKCSNRYSEHLQRALAT